MSAGMALRGDRVLRYVTAFCPNCHDEAPERPLAHVARLSGRLTERDGRVWLERGCPTHGLVRTLYDEDPEILAYLEEWTASTKGHIPDVAGNFDPIPSAYLRGLPEMQKQHTCILLEEIAEACNLRCPTCFTDSSPDLRNVVPVADVLASVDQRLARENGRLDVLMLSGGEPTLHPQLRELLDELTTRPITRILVNTNGLRIATDDGLLDLLTTHRDRVETYLQYDGISEAAHRHHRGGDLRQLKARALQRLSEREIFTTLVMTAALGVNDTEIGDMVQLALNTPYVGGLTIQPQFGSGRSGMIDPQDRLTHTGVLKRLGPQTNNSITWRDLTALPCSHPHCCSVGYMIRDDAGRLRSLVSLIGHDSLKAKLGLVANRIADTEIPKQLRLAVQESLLGLLSEQSSLSHPDIGEVWKNICESCDLGMSTLLALASSALPGRRRKIRRLLGERVVRLTIKPFMDMSTMIEERLVQCCVQVGTRSDQNQCAPFCAVQAWPALARQRLPRRSIIIAAATAATVIVLVLILGFGAPGFFKSTSLDVNAAQSGVKQILMDQADGYGVKDVKEVTCNNGKNPPLRKGETFDCSVDMDGAKRQVTVTITGDDGTYEVGRPEVALHALAAVCDGEPQSALDRHSGSDGQSMEVPMVCRTRRRHSASCADVNVSDHGAWEGFRGVADEFAVGMPVGVRVAASEMCP